MSRLALLAAALLLLGISQVLLVRSPVGAWLHRRLGPRVLTGVLVLLAIGDLARIGSKVRGFDLRRLLLGLAALLLLEWLRRQWVRQAPWIEAMRQGITDLRGVSGSPPASSSRVGPLLATGLVVVTALGARAWDSWTLFLNHRYLDLVQASGAAVDPWGVISGAVCTDPLGALPISVVLAPWAAWLDTPLGILVSRTLVGLALALVAVGPWIRSPRGWVALGAWSLLQLDLGAQFPRSALFEPFFALLFLVNLRMLLSPSRSPSFWLALGLVTGFTWMHKEMNLLNLALGVLVLARGPEPPRTLIRLAAAWAIGAGIGALPYWLRVMRCGESEGLNLLPLLALRGAEWATTMTQSLAHLVSREDLPSDLASILWNRWSLQTLGEVIEGAVRSMGPLVLTFLCPVVWFALHLPREQFRRLTWLLVMTAGVLGFTWWKGGDSAEALPLLLPFGVTASWPFLRDLGTGWIDSFPRGTWRRLRSLPIHLLVLAQVLAVACWAPRMLRTLSSFPAIARWVANRAPDHSGLLETVEGLRRQGVLGDVLVCQGCKDRLDPLFWELADRGVFVVDLDARFHLLEALEQGRWEALEQTLVLIPHQASKRMRPRDPDPFGPGGAPARESLLLSDPDGHREDLLRERLRWLRPCLDIEADSRDTGFLLLRLEVSACRDLLDPARRPEEPWVESSGATGGPGFALRANGEGGRWNGP